MFCLCVAASTAPSSQSPVRHSTFVLHYVQKPIGFERDELRESTEGLELTSDFDFTDRGGRVQLSSTLRTTSDLSPRFFRSKGQTYRFVNVDSEISIENGVATVRADGRQSRLRLPDPAFVADGYAPLAAQMLLVRYWQRHGRPRSLPTVPGLSDAEAMTPNDVRVEERGSIDIRVGDRSIALTEFVIDGVVWGRETLWLDGSGDLAAAITRAGGLAFEAVRDDLEPALVQFVELSTRSRMADLEAMTRATPPIRDGTYALVGATIVDMTPRAPLRDGVVIVRDGRIAAVGPRGAVALPKDVGRVDVAGKTIVPGLWDMHTHVTQVEWGPVYLAAGVTTARDMGNEFEFITPLRDAMNAHRVVGPRLVLAGLIDGPGPGAFGAVSVATSEEAIAAVRRYHDAGFAEIKIYNLVAPPIVETICREAHALGMSVTGHVPNGMTIVQAASAGMDQIAHLAIPGEAGSPPVIATIASLKARGTVMDPTQSWNELLGRSDATDVTEFQPGFPLIPAPLQRVFSSAAVKDITPAEARARLERGLRIVRALHAAGVPIVAGTDEGIPGHSLHRELELYVEAGLTPLDALRAATVVPARVMNMDRDLGTIEAGKRADLVVLDANPLDDIRNIRRIRWTISDGRVYDPGALWRAVRFSPPAAISH